MVLAKSCRWTIIANCGQTVNSPRSRLDILFPQRAEWRAISVMSSACSCVKCRWMQFKAWPVQAQSQSGRANRWCRPTSSWATSQAARLLCWVDLRVCLWATRPTKPERAWNATSTSHVKWICDDTGKQNSFYLLMLVLPVIFCPFPDVSNVCTVGLVFI